MSFMITKQCFSNTYFVPEFVLQVPYTDDS